MYAITSLFSLVIKWTIKRHNANIVVVNHSWSNLWIKHSFAQE